MPLKILPMPFSDGFNYLLSLTSPTFFPALIILSFKKVYAASDY